MRPGLGTWGAALAVLFCSLTARAADAPAKFDYWVLSLSWSPEFCVSNFGDEECRQQFGFVVRGLSPQNEHGKSPTRCGDRKRVDKELTTRMLPLMATEREIQSQWHRYGSRSEEHTSELQSLMRISYAVFCLKKKKHDS